MGCGCGKNKQFKSKITKKVNFQEALIKTKGAILSSVPDEYLTPRQIRIKGRMIRKKNILIRSHRRKLRAERIARRNARIKNT